jgi:hypothetical protein
VSQGARLLWCSWVAGVNEPGIKLTTYFSERARSGDRSSPTPCSRCTSATSCTRAFYCEACRVSVGAISCGVTACFLPAVSIAVDSCERVGRALPEVLRVPTRGVISLERAQLVGGADLGRLRLSHEPNRAVKLTLFGGRSVRSGRQAGHVAAVDLLRRAGAADATVLLAVDGLIHCRRRTTELWSEPIGTYPLSRGTDATGGGCFGLARGNINGRLDNASAYQQSTPTTQQRPSHTAVLR